MRKMKRKPLYFATTIFAICAVMILSFNPLPVLASGSITSNEQTDTSYQIIVPLAATIDWRYKVENGKLYKRLYNYQMNVWVGEWILCP